jgi:DNA-binding NtrC family response regulator
VQAALLGALERRSFRRLGGQKPISVDVRVISATHRDLRSEVNSGSFRQDLYYRVAVLLLKVPPLRARPSDLPLLVEYFLEEAGYLGDPEQLIPASSMAALKQHHWPGNVRELRNFVDAAIAMGQPPALEEPPPGSRPEPAASIDGELIAELGPPGEGAVDVEVPYSEARAALLQQFEASYLRALVDNTRGNISLAARKAKMDRSYLMQLLKRHGIKVQRDR